MDKFGTKGPTEKLILICIDSSKHSARAFNWYYTHFYREEHIIGLAYIYTQPETPTFDPDNGEYRRRVREVLKKSESITHTFQEVCAQRGMKSRVLTEEKFDTIGNTICKIAKETNAACIVMGQRGMGAIKRAVMGSVSDYVLHHAHVTVLVVPPSKDEKD